jgi:chromosome segregation ATPase
MFFLSSFNLVAKIVEMKSQLSLAVEEFASERAGLTAEAALWQDKHDAVSAKLGELEKQLAQTRARLSEAEAMQADPEKMAKLEAQVQNLTAEIADMQQEKIMLGTAWHEQMLQFQSQIDTLTAGNAALQTELDDLQQGKEQQIATTLTSVQAELESLRTIRDSVADQLAAAHAARDTLAVEKSVR